MGEADQRDLDGPPPTVIVDGLDIVYRVHGAGPVSTPSLLRRLRRPAHRAPTRPVLRTVHALQGVSLVAYRGDAHALVGHNGSGKSTLLRAIAGLLPPHRGAVYTDSQPALLGVNAALMSDLSGERNIELGCLALGMSPREVKAKRDEIAEFAGLGEFLSLPMRTYSSGMAARLRFAIAAAQTPDVLLIDEALATGDAEFRQRSEQRIRELREQAGTVFLVSHSLSVVRETCNRAIWLDTGRVVMDGPTDAVLEAYERRFDPSSRTHRAAPLWEAPTLEEWLAMATEEDLRRIVREEVAALFAREDSPLAVQNDDYDPQDPTKGNRRISLARAVYRAYSQSRKAASSLLGDSQSRPAASSLLDEKRASLDEKRASASGTDRDEG
jgi:teichoic acid transport system ATP-binding protein